MIRLFLFLLSYGLIVTTCTTMITYLNYTSMGFDMRTVAIFILRSADFAMFAGAAVLLLLTVYVRVPSRLPFS
ncbi:hypothetical protein NCCP2716_00680 [Sporosarcina sp. NCCP-2716]|uniref:hypothetical protein n=1 Tax=Sporosarcina sp. NCCP-2716 TaxID=2943679 RepID=UPI002041356F|nr:hypothetical protein [Sporosarcina sp. NCCP-2716]GKV67570.1 hypothetical protein NCCP2716_00680 [Sporosarcina sp. NCCP-2716]